MSWRHDWPAYKPRPKLARTAASTREALLAKITAFVARSPVLRELVKEVQLARGRIYLWRDRNEDDLMARITPLTRVTVLLEAQWRSGWTEAARGSLQVVLNALDRDRHGTFHGLGTLARRRKPKPGEAPSVQEVLHREHGVPLPVVAEPGDWYSMHRTPVIAEVDAARKRILVRFGAFGPHGDFHGTCLYAEVDGEWGCFTVKPNAADSIADAEAWLAKRGWEPW